MVGRFGKGATARFPALTHGLEVGFGIHRKLTGMSLAGTTGTAVTGNGKRVTYRNQA